MTSYEYKVVPAPTQGQKAKGLKSTGDRFAHALAEVLNEAAADGWEYVRADTLPCDERRGLTGTQTTYQNLLIFRRQKAAASETLPPLTLDAQMRQPAEPRREPPLRAVPQPED